jgi:hypothetical protein
MLRSTIIKYDAVVGIAIWHGCVIDGLPYYRVHKQGHVLAVGRVEQAGSGVPPVLFRR